MTPSGKTSTPSLGMTQTAASSRSNIVFAVGLVVILATLLLRMPTPLLDMLLACSISLSIAVLLVTISSHEPLELSAFPSLLLLVTMFRLSLNVASTRLILTQGDAGKIIQTFGDFVAGGSFVVGLVIFVILFIIQFIVVTKGAERISEVSARFTLDAMPGKQMAVDADLNAGAITEAQANERRAKIVKESEFYGAMDGASKFIRGDAKAGIIITLINILGGIATGCARGMSISDAIRTYSVLSIGDGLVSQIPSMIISISSGFLVTKISSSRSVGQDLSRQFLKNSQPLTVASLVIAALGFVPGLPMLPFFLLAGATALTGRMMASSSAVQETKHAAEQKPAKEQKQPLEELLDVDKVSVHVGVRLIGMVDPRKDSAIFDRIGALRRRFAQQMGIIMPLVRIKDSISLEPNAYEIRIFDHIVARGKLQPEMYLAMDSGTVQDKIDGLETTEPVYGLPALWIAESQRQTAELNGYTVIDPESVFITHLSETLKKHAAELLTRDDVQQLVDRLRKTQPSLVGDVVGDLVPIGILQRVLKNLLAGGIPIRELPIILEALAEAAVKTKNTDMLTEMVRKHLSRTICEQYKNDKGRIPALTLEPALEHQLTASLRQEGDTLVLGLRAETAMQLTHRIAQAWKAAADKGVERPVLLCDSRLRYSLSAMLSRAVPLLGVLAYDEIVLGTEIEPVQTVSLPKEGQLETDEPVLAAQGKG
ncbi:MAG TPA: flagellar biosynthesis protein FlhA [Anaerohalosphaeraceae bacterium]|nr:flagellar biosynthesis protein FlhA [Anaerohalosphaeraceae bacterium]HOM76723.1 flagellar biosynthesis protein FlhA [Anaerohalosphaeraceae bacterium]HPC63047.1 flagellar biosynthesis protein FlhA [Anaerohalosphaeraceae bacterium]HPO69246.1 flagellar biosynthesis protein FlhA [Anaerohalosphaeraceae bacterium]HRV20191.1 flagellar biosynthesis protein FlhA [Anaerohalosphaeraceae bacterium]